MRIIPIKDMGFDEKIFTNVAELFDKIIRNQCGCYFQTALKSYGSFTCQTFE